MPNHPRKALTLPEVLVLVGLACIMLCLLLPALLRGRDKTRTNHCQARVQRLILAVHQFESTTGAYPSGSINPTGPISNSADGSLHHSWIVHLLPFIKEEQTFAEIDLGVSVYDAKHLKVRETLIPAIACPATPETTRSEPGMIQHSNYAGCYHDSESPLDLDNNGVFFLNSEITKAAVSDGLTYTLFLGEVRATDVNTLGWMSGTRATLRNTGSAPNSSQQAPPAPESTEDEFYMGGFGSWHVGISHIAMGDGEVKAMSNSIDPVAFQQLGSRRDGTALNPLPVAAQDDPASGN